MCRATRLCCFRCLNWFDKDGSKECGVCGDWKCVSCGSCLCNLTISEKKVAISYMATYENLLKEITHESYDFRRHRVVLQEIGARRNQLIRGRVRG